MTFVMRCTGHNGLTWNADAPDVTGCYLLDYDPDFADGLGMAVWTLIPEDAMRFASATDLIDLWLSKPRSRPVRSYDGQPNRPLTAYTVEAVRLADVAPDAPQGG